MLESLKHKPLVITGASSGFGLEMAKTLAKQGAHLMLGARRLNRLEKIQSELSHFTQVEVHALDVTDPLSVTTFTSHTLKTFGSVFALINNAGLALGRDPIATASIEDYQTMMDTNYFGTLRMIQAFLPQFEKQQFGNILNVGSIAGHEAYAGGAGYCASKFSVRALTQTLRMELLGKNIRVMLLDPGLAETEFSVVRFKGDEAKAAQVYEGLTPLKGQDIAHVVQFMLALPHHINLDDVRLTPLAQASATLVHRSK